MQPHRDSTSRFREFFERVSPQFDQTVHRYAARRRGEALSAHAKGRVLEVGCGSGAVTQYLVPKGKVMAGDLAWGMAKETRDRIHIPVVAFNAERFPFRGESFDTVVCAEAIYYLNEPRRLLEEAYRVLRTPGLFALSCMTTLWQRVDWIRIQLTRIGVRYGSSVPPSQKVLPQRWVRDAIEDVGFAIDEVRPLILLPFQNLHSMNLRLETSFLAPMCIFWAFRAVKR